jgi:hypothetical protein
MSIDDNNARIEYLMALVEHTGAACSTVSDGHIIVMKRDRLKKLLQQNSDSDTVVVFIKRQDMTNAQ